MWSLHDVVLMRAEAGFQGDGRLADPGAGVGRITHVLKATAEHEIEQVVDPRAKLHLKIRDAATENIASLFTAAIGFINGAEKAHRCASRSSTAFAQPPERIRYSFVSHRQASAKCLDAVAPACVPAPGARELG